MNDRGGLQIRRADARFLLPALPRTAAVLGDLPGWVASLGAAGVALVAEPDAATDLVVAPARLARQAAARRTGAVILEGTGGGGRALTRAGLSARRLLCLPDAIDPRVVVPVRHHRAARYAIVPWTSEGGPGGGRVRRDVAASLAAVGLLPPILPALTVGVRQPGAPALLAAAGEVTPVARGAQWFLSAESGVDAKRSAFFLFEPGCGEPAEVVKFARVPGHAASFEREAAGLALAARTGGAVASHAPRHRGGFELDQHHVSVQTAAVGRTLERSLVGPGSRAGKLRLVEAVFEWLLTVAEETAGPAEAARAEREHSFAEAGLWDQAIHAEHIPTVLQHNDLSGGNIIIGDAKFTVVDWEWARAGGFPLWDLLHFSLHALPLLDGAGGDPDDQTLVDLFIGRSASSPLLFRWMCTAVHRMGLPPASVGALATLCWSHHAATTARVRTEMESPGGRALPILAVERIARLWDRHPGLGASWDHWRSWRP